MNGKGSPLLDTGRVPSRQREFSLALPLSIFAHLMVLAALLWLHVGPPTRPSEPSPMLVNVVDAPEPEPELEAEANAELEPAAEPPGPPGPPGPPDATQVDAGVPRVAVAPTPQPQPAPVQAAEEMSDPAPLPDTSDVLSDSQIAGAVSADNDGGGGGGGIGGCDTARTLQRALQRDPLVRRAVVDANRSGMAVMLWNGDWVRSGAQDGKGLSGVREAIMWELAFAPEACRNMRVQGLVLLSLADGTRFAIGASDWRWSDLLGLRGR